jgi:hypothetical protein
MSNPVAVWKKEIYYENPISVGHVIGYGGYNVRKWLNEYDCNIIIDDKRHCIIIIGNNELSVIKTTVEVQERLLVSWKYINIDKQYDLDEKELIIREKDQLIMDKDHEIDMLNKSIKEKDEVLFKIPLPNICDAYNSFEHFEHDMSHIDNTI